MNIGQNPPLQRKRLIKQNNRKKHAGELQSREAKLIVARKNPLIKWE